jgi:hypothetical protein
MIKSTCLLIQVCHLSKVVKITKVDVFIINCRGKENKENTEEDKANREVGKERECIEYG